MSDNPTLVKLYVDGGCKGNGTVDARSYGSYCVVATRSGFEVVQRCEMFDLLDCHTNNQAEYGALHMALEYCHGLVERAPGFNFQFQVFMDSALVVNQVAGNWKIKDPDLRNWCTLVKDTLKGLSVELHHVDREIIVSYLGH